MDESKVSVNELAKACAISAEAAEWELLLQKCAPIASLVAVRISRLWLGSASPAIVSDIVQEVFLKLCERDRRILREFKPRGNDSFLGLVRIVSASVANDYFRRQYSTKRGGKVVTVGLDESPTLSTLAKSYDSSTMQKNVLFSELDRRMRAAPEVISERDRAIFWLYYLQGMTAAEIAALPGSALSAKGIESALHRVTLWLRKQTGPKKRESQVATAEEPS